MSQLIDGKQIALELRQDIAKQVERLKADHGITPGLAVVLVGEDPASQVYVRSKHRATVKAGMNSFEHKLDKEAGQQSLLKLVDQLNHDPAVHGILVQLPLPDHLNEDEILLAIDPKKDVDGFHPVNVGRLSLGLEGLVPCTPRGCVKLAKSVKDDLSGLSTVIIGRSNIVGKPVAQLFLAENTTVTIAHSRTKDLPGLVKTADIVIAAVGRPLMVKGNWIKPGAIVIDVGINRLAGNEGNSKLVGDVDFEDCKDIAGAITPVPGGVGPMTIACLLENTLIAARQKNGVNLAEI